LAGEPIDLSLDLLNTTEATLYHRIFSPLEEYPLSVLNQKGQEIRLTRFGRLVLRSGMKTHIHDGPIEMSPKEHVVHMMPLSRMYDLSLPGEYSVQAKHEVLTPDWKALATVTSARTNFRILAPTPSGPELHSVAPDAAAISGAGSPDEEPVSAALAGWKIGDSWKIGVTWYPASGSALHYTLQIAVTGEARVSGAECWQIDFTPGRDAPPGIAERSYRVLADKSDKMARKAVCLSHNGPDPDIISSGSLRLLVPPYCFPIQFLPLASNLIKNPDDQLATISSRRATDAQVVEVAYKQVPVTFSQRWSDKGGWWTSYAYKSRGHWNVLARLLKEKPTSGLAERGLKLVANCEDAAVPPGQPVILHLRIQNIGSLSIKPNDQNAAKAFRFTVKDSRNRLVPLTDFGAESMGPTTATEQSPLRSTGGGIMRLPPGTIPPGQEMAYTILLNHLYDMTLEGTYSITVEGVVNDPKGRALALATPVAVNVTSIFTGEFGSNPGISTPVPQPARP